MKKFISMFLTAALALGLVACGGGSPTDSVTSNNEGTNTNTQAPNNTSVESDDPTDDETISSEGKTLLYYTPYIGDFGLGDMGHRASLAAAEKYGLDFTLVEYGTDSSVAVNSFLDAIETNHYDYVIASSWYITDIVIEKSVEYSDTVFILYDTSPTSDMSDYDNIYGITFGQNEGGFLVGVYSALMTETNKIGVALRGDSPILNDFGTGWLAGYKYAVSDLEQDNVDMMFSYIGEDSVQNTYETCKVLFENGVDYIWSVAGTNNLGAAQAADESGGVEGGATVIGVDYDQWEYFSNLENAEVSAVGYDHIVTSMLKNIEPAVALVFESLFGNGDIEPGNSFYGVAEDGTGLAKNERYYDVTPDDVDEVITELEEKIKNGEIDVPSYFDFETYEAFAAYRDNPDAEFKP